MPRFTSFHRFRVAKLAALAFASMAVASATLALAQGEPHKFKNLKVLPQDISQAELRSTMGGFARALGVRCGYCHVEHPGQPLSPEDLALDDKPTKLKARAMLKMVQDINNNYLANLEQRADPPVRVGCFSCHHGVAQPRAIQDVLGIAYDRGGLDSTLARYQALRSRYYGSAAYDFGEVPLSLVAAHAESTGHNQDSARLLALNVEMNPGSDFAKRQQVMSTLGMAFRAGADSGAALYRDYHARYGDVLVSEPMLNQLGYTLLGAGQMAPALQVFKLNVSEHPASANTYDSLGELYAMQGDQQQAKAAYTKSLELDPKNDHAKQQLEELKSGGKSKK